MGIMIKKPIFQKILILVLIFAASLVIFVPFISRGLLTHYALKTAEDVLQMDVSISNAELHLLSGSMKINDMAVYHPKRKDEKFIEAKSIKVGLKLSPMLVGEKPSLSVEVNSPNLIYITDRAGNWELKDQVPLFRRGEGEERLPLNVERIIIDDGKVTYKDGKVGKTTRLSDIELDVKRVQLPTKDDPLPAEFDLAFKIDGSAKLKMKGRADFLSPKVSFDSDINLYGLPLPPFSPYYDKQNMPVKIIRGNMDMSSHAKCTNDYLKAPAHMTITSLRVEPKKSSILGFTADKVVDNLKDKDGRLELDVMISGNIKSPSFHVTNSLSSAFAGSFAKGLTEGIKNVPDKLEDAGKDLGSKIKGIFGK